MKSLKNFIKKRDFFGHPIQLNFNKKGNTHNTFLGGFLSLFVQAGLIIYFVIHVDKLVNKLDDKLNRTTSIVDLNDGEEVALNQTSFNVMWFFTMDNLPLLYDEHAKKYITITYNHIEVKELKLDDSGILPYTSTISGIRKCTADDFKRTDMLKARYLELVNSLGDLFFCPEKNDYFLKGGP